MSKEKSRKLGMSFGTARDRLERDLLFSLATKLGETCYRCGGELTRDTFSVEHKAPWMQAENPKQSFFDLDNVAFSHVRCNQLDMVSRRRKSPEYQRERHRRNQANWSLTQLDRDPPFKRSDVVAVPTGPTNSGGLA